MLSRTQRSTLVFSRPFAVKGISGLQPAGTYAVETEEELIDGLSFPAYRRVATVITRAPTRPGATTQAIPVDPQDLDLALAAEAASAATGGRPGEG